MAFGDLIAPIIKEIQNSDGTTALEIENTLGYDVEILQILVQTDDSSANIVFIYNDVAGVAGKLVGAFIMEPNGYRDGLTCSGWLFTNADSLWVKANTAVASGKKLTVTLRCQKLS